MCQQIVLNTCTACVHIINNHVRRKDLVNLALLYPRYLTYGSSILSWGLYVNYVKLSLQFIPTGNIMPLFMDCDLLK